MPYQSVSQTHRHTDTMGFFSKNETKDMPPNKSARKICWESRDLFFDCLTANDIDNSLDPKEESKVSLQCGSLREDFKNKCVASWFEYFQQKRYQDIRRDRYIKQLESEGAQPLPFKLEPPRK